MAIKVSIPRSATAAERTVDAIFCSDIHLRDSQPECRTDNFEDAQWRKLDFIAKLQRKYNCPVYHAGDLFHHWKPSPYLLAKTFQHLPDNFHTIYGNHDLPQHNMELAHKCGIYAVMKAGRLNLLPGIHWGEEPHVSQIVNIRNRKVLIWHVMTYQGKSPFPGCTDVPARSLLRKFPGVDVILTGHNHKPFIEEYERRMLINPGGMTRQESDEADANPRVYLYYAETNSVEIVWLPINPGVVSVSEARQARQERNDRIDAFISKLNDNWELDVSFEKNIERAIKANKVSKGVKQKILKSIEV